MGGNWTAPNPPFGAVFTYNVAAPLPAAAKLVLTITDDTGRQIRRLDIDRSVGLASGDLELAGRSRHQRSYRTCCGDDRSSASSGRPRQYHPTGRTRTLSRHARHRRRRHRHRTWRPADLLGRAGGPIARDSGLGTRDSGFGIAGSGLASGAPDGHTRTEAVLGHAEAPDAQPERRRVAAAFRRKTCPRRKLRQSGNRPRDRRCEDPLRPGRLQSVQSPGPAAIAAGSPAWLRSDLAV